MDQWSNWSKRLSPLSLVCSKCNKLWRKSLSYSRSSTCLHHTEGKSLQAYEKAHHDYERHIDSGELQNNGTKEGKLQSERRKSKIAFQPFYLYVIHMEKLYACFSKINKQILEECKKGRHIKSKRPTYKKSKRSTSWKIEEEEEERPSMTRVSSRMLGTYFYVIGISFNKMHFTCIWINLWRFNMIITIGWI